MIKKSASSLDTFSNCARKWAWKAIAKIPSPHTRATQLGEDVHLQLERYLLTGEYPDQSTLAGQIATSGLHHLPPPKAEGLVIEGVFEFEYRGHLYTGRKDFEIVPQVNPDKEKSWPIVGDHKTTSDFKWMKTPEILRTDIQANLYALESATKYDSPGVDLYWVYYRTRGTPQSRQVHLRIAKQEVEKNFDRTLRLSDEMEQAVLTAGGDVLALPPNTNHCNAMGGCPYVAHCQLTLEQKMDSLMDQANIPKMDIWSNLTAGDAGGEVDVPTPLPTPAQATPAQATAPAQAVGYSRDSLGVEYWHCYCGLNSAVQTLAENQGKCLGCGRGADNFPAWLCVDNGDAAAAALAPAPVVAPPVVQDYQINPPESTLERPTPSSATLPPAPAAEQRKRGRPRKNPLPESAVVVQAPAPVAPPVAVQAPVVSPPVVQAPAPVAPPAPVAVQAPAPVVAPPSPVVAPPVVQAPAPVAPPAPVSDTVKKIEILYIDCAPVGGQFVDLAEALNVVRIEASRLAERPDYRMADYGKGPGIFAYCFDQLLETLTEPILEAFLSTETQEAKIVINSLIANSRIVVRSTVR